ncbi:RusA family crossover junction endodeoxyribonuclease [Cytobacillus oceanisediminis]|uniref:RusA family crossover junction endodeoxyribonuclease n=1 Tax=Cytobacillus oceanisediminis TaxID=665099 RepID=UPI001C231893|nr:RusA family crossover junction endodeoxyribonuclease [Cytobacillus oceanisediminis]MBU8733458.1 RusA family crossover junction endodeoxyribonuclease [Cytobacillus oceanisediminis]
MIKLNVKVEPMGAVRMTGRGKFIKPNAQRYLHYKNHIQWHTKKQLKNRKTLSGAVAVEILFIMPIPGSWSRKKRDAAVGEWHVKKPDTDNLVKGVFDSLNKIAWNDDNQVAKVTACKLYGESPGIEIIIRELEVTG